MTRISSSNAPAVAPARSDKSVSKGNRLLEAVKARLPRVNRQAARIANTLTPRNYRVEDKLARCQEDIDQGVEALLAQIMDPKRDEAAISRSVATLMTNTVRPRTSRGENADELFARGVRSSVRTMPDDKFLLLLASVIQQRESQADARHFVSIAYHDIRTQVRVELGERLASGLLASTPELQATLSRLDSDHFALAAAVADEAARAAKSGKQNLPIGKHANAALLKPVRADVQALYAMQRADQPRLQAEAAVRASAAVTEAARRSVNQLMGKLTVAMTNPKLYLVEASIEDAMSHCGRDRQFFRDCVTASLAQLPAHELSVLRSNIGKIRPTGRPNYFADAALRDIKAVIDPQQPAARPGSPAAA